MGPNVQNRHFEELRQKAYSAELRRTVCLYIHVLALLRGVPSLEARTTFLWGKKRKMRLANSSHTDYSNGDFRQT